MTRPKLFIHLLFIAVCVAAPLVVHISAHQRQVDRERALQEQSKRLAELSAARDQSPAPTKLATPPALSDAEHTELLRLRNEVGRLRRETNAIPQLQDENRKLAAQPTASTNSTPEIIRRESWTFAGYATPDAALQSFIWGMSQGDTNTILNSLRGQMADEMREQFARAAGPDAGTQMASASKNISGYRIVARETLPDDEMLLQFEPTDPTTSNTRKQIVKLKKIDGEWKLVSRPR